MSAVLSRREVLAGGLLVVAFGLQPRGWAAGSEGGETGSAGGSLPGSLGKQPFLDGWIQVAADGRVTVFTGKAELGQGIKTALIQVAAEELVVDPAKVDIVTADTARTADEGYTAGSHSMQDSGTAIRHAAAQVRAILAGLAARKLGVGVSQLQPQGGVFGTADGRKVGYGELVSGSVLHVQAQPKSELRPSARFTVMGKALPRRDIPAKLTGGAAYVQDLRLPGMVHARVLRPPSPSAELQSLDAAAVEKLPGVLKVVRDGRFVAVIAQREWQAVTAQRALSSAAKWTERESLPVQRDLFTALPGMPSQDNVVAETPPGAAAGTKTVAAEYRKPYQLHASIGPSCAVAQLQDGTTTVWTHSQGVFPLRGALAELLGQPPERIRCVHMEGSGCYGHNAADDVAADAALLAQALPGKPVRVQWMREDEHMWEPYGPPMVTRARAALDAGGRIASWQYELWSNTHNSRPGKAGDLLAGRHVARAFAPSPPQPGKQPEGAGDRNSVPLYALPGVKVVQHFLPDMPLRVSALRSLGAYMNVFSIESFMDELARAAGADPVAFRLAHLQDARAQAVIKLAAEKFNWSGWKRTGAGHGRGFAFARYKNLAAFLAVACEVMVSRETGEVRVDRVVAAVDTGEVANPDGVRNQIEGGIVQSLSWTLSEEVKFDRARVLTRDWAGYPILRFPQVPREVQVHIVPRPDDVFLGAGEAAQGPTAGAVANAIADACGARMRQLPISREHLRAALSA